MYSIIPQHKLVVIALLPFLISCDLLKVKSEKELDAPEKIPVARVHNTYLYQSDLGGIIETGSTKEDSTARINRYVNNWVRKQLLIDEAKSKIDFDEADIERKISNYRYSLIAYQYQNYYINKHINNQVSNQEIEEYYQTHQNNFPLKQNIIRGKFIKLAKTTPKINKVKYWMLSAKEKDAKSLEELCFSNAANYTLEDSVWINYDDLVRGSPFAENPNTVRFLRSRKYAETEDEKFKYFIKISDYKKTDDIAPLEVVKDQIADIIINKRKIELAENLEKEVYNEAKKQNSFEIFK